MPTIDQTVEVEGRRIRLTHLERVLYPATGTTKADIVRYYVEIAPRILPMLRSRIVTRRRFPDGVDEPGFYERNTPSHAPEWLRVVELPHGSSMVRYPVVESLSDLVWLEAHSALELHTPQWTVTTDGQRSDPDRIVFDLDPGPPAGLPECVEVALWLRERLEDDDLTSVPVTSGSKGIQVYALWRSRDVTSIDYAKQIAVEASQVFKGRVVSTMVKAQRENKVFIDWSQNNPAKTTICPYSTRAKDRPYVAAPRAWSELVDASDLRHLEIGEVLDRLADDDPMVLFHSA